MTGKQIKLAREQLDKTMRRFESLKTTSTPPRGWVRAIRDTLGMTGDQLARRMGIKQQRIARIEQDEVRGKVTLQTMQKVAEAMDCVFVYGMVPRDSLEAVVRRQAHLAAQKRLERSTQTMRLEKQELSREEKSKVLKSLVEEIIDTMPKSLWEATDGV